MNDMFTDVVRRAEASTNELLAFVLELGSGFGGSAIAMAELLKASGRAGGGGDLGVGGGSAPVAAGRRAAILCVDPFAVGVIKKRS